MAKPPLAVGGLDKICRGRLILTDRRTGPIRKQIKESCCRDTMQSRARFHRHFAAAAVTPHAPPHGVPIHAAIRVVRWARRRLRPAISPRPRYEHAQTGLE